MAPLDDGECESAADIDADDEGDENSSLLDKPLVVPFKIDFHCSSFSPTLEHLA